MRWWDACRLVNGVFKGGGARGIAYAGALEALESQRTWFNEVAGASAGAITAALVASGMHPKEMRNSVPSALSSIKRRPFALVAGLHSALFDSSGLANWLENTLRRQLRCGIGFDETPTVEGPSGAVTFEDLFKSSGIGLYVVAMDLATKRPLVFHHLLTPHASVSLAVTASAAIPGGFQAGRALAVDADANAVHRLVDGGAWANYPAFVFRDSSFRAWAFGETRESAKGERPVVGFVLGDDRAGPTRVIAMLERASGVPSEFDAGTSRTSGAALEYALATAIGGRATRLVLLIVTLLGAGATFAQMPRLFRYLSEATLGWPAGAHGAVTYVVEVLVVAAAIVTTAITVGVLLFGRAISTTVIQAVRASLGVATGVPPWIGTAHDDYVVTLSARGLTTTNFNVSTELAERVIAEARAEAEAQLRSFNRMDALRPRQRGVVDSGPPDIDSLAASSGKPHLAVTALGVSFILLVLAFATQAIGATRLWVGLLLSLVGLLAGGAVVLGGAPLARLRSRIGNAGALDRGRAGGAVTVGLVAFGLAGLVWAYLEGGYRQEALQSDSSEVRIRSAEIAPGESDVEFRYRFDQLSGEPLAQDHFDDSARHFVGDTILVSDRTGEIVASVLGPVDYAAPLVVAIWSLFLVGGGYRRYRMARRDRAVCTWLDGPVGVDVSALPAQ